MRSVFRVHVRPLGFFQQAGQPNETIKCGKGRGAFTANGGNVLDLGTDFGDPAFEGPVAAHIKVRR